MATIPHPPLILNTTPDVFARWLEGFADQAFSQPIPLRNGQVEIALARPTSDQWSDDPPFFVQIIGRYSENSITAEPGGRFDTLYYFSVVALDSARIAVFPRCDEPSAREYLDHILTMMRATWPGNPPTQAHDDNPLKDRDSQEHFRSETELSETGMGEAFDILEWLPIRARDKKIVEQWRAEHTAGEIAESLGLSEKTVNNRISELRKRYGTIIVPLRISPKTGTSGN